MSKEIIYSGIAFDGKKQIYHIQDTSYSEAIEKFINKNEFRGYRVLIDCKEYGTLRQVYKTNKDVKITKDNIHLYYEFMSDEEKYKNKDFFEYEMHGRMMEILHNFDKNRDYIENYQSLTVDDFREIVKDQTYFGIKDTLKPIDEYIAEIKESSEYKEYIKTKGFKMAAITKKKLNRYDYAILKDGISIGTASNQMEYWEALPLDCNMKKFKTLKECVEYISTKQPQ